MKNMVGSRISDFNDGSLGFHDLIPKLIGNEEIPVFF